MNFMTDSQEDIHPTALIVVAYVEGRGNG